MKKACISLFLALALLLSLGAGATAQAGYIADEAALLSVPQISSLEQQAEKAARFYGVGLYVIVADDWQDYGGDDVFDCAMDLYEQLELGIGEKKNGMLLLLSLAERDYALAGYGADCHRAINDKGIDYLEEQFLPLLADDDWAGGIAAYVSAGLWLLEQDSQGHTYGTAGLGRLPRLLIIFLLPLLISGIICGAMVWSMRKARRQTHAHAYIPQDGVDLRVSKDTFIHRSVSRQKIESSNSSTSVNSRGFSGSSGKF